MSKFIYIIRNLAGKIHPVRNLAGESHPVRNLVSKSTLKDIVLISLFTIFSTLLVWAPFLLRIKSFWGLSYPGDGMITIWRNFDGLNYIAVARSFYNPQILQDLFSSLGLSPIYFSSHFPLYPAFISLFAPIFGFLTSMLFVTVLFSVASAVMFYLLVRDFKLTSSPLFLTIIFLLLPARWVVVRSVGAPEPLFIFTILAAVYFLKKEKYFLVGLFTAAAVLTRSPGAILFIAILIYLLLPTLRAFWQKNFKLSLSSIPWKAWPLVFAPLSALGLFFWYKTSYGDFLAYFHSGDNIHLTWPPFPIFNSAQFWVGTFWLEHAIFAYLLIAAGTVLLFRKGLLEMGLYSGIYLLASSFVAHLDITRYLIPALPFAIIGMEKWLVSKEFKWILLFLLIPIYLFTQNFLLGNTAPIADFTPFK